MGYTVTIDSNGDPQVNFTLLAGRLDRDQVGFVMYPVGSFLLDHNDTDMPVSALPSVYLLTRNHSVTAGSQRNVLVTFPKA